MSILIILFGIFFSIYVLYWVYIKPAYYESFEIIQRPISNTKILPSTRSKCFDCDRTSNFQHGQKCFDCEHKPRDITLNKSLLR